MYHLGFILHSFELYRCDGDGVDDMVVTLPAGPALSWYCWGRGGRRGGKLFKASRRITNTWLFG